MDKEAQQLLAVGIMVLLVLLGIGGCCHLMPAGFFDHTPVAH